MIAALYCRKSTDDGDRNAEARSTRRQIERATAYAERKGWTVDPRYIFVDENTSGAEWKHRPGFNALLAAIEGPEMVPGMVPAPMHPGAFPCTAVHCDTKTPLVESQ